MLHLSESASVQSDLATQCGYPRHGYIFFLINQMIDFLKRLFYQSFAKKSIVVEQQKKEYHGIMIFFETIELMHLMNVLKNKKLWKEYLPMVSWPRKARSRSFFSHKHIVWQLYLYL